MAVWDVWKPAYDRLTLAAHGDATEMQAARDEQFMRGFPEYEAFWRYHIATATNRPVSIDQRPQAWDEAKRMGSLSHALVVNLLQASAALARVRAGELGNVRFENCTAAIKADGDALMQFDELHKLLPKVSLHTPVWGDDEWKSDWLPRRNQIINYRNLLTHHPQPYILWLPQPDGSTVPGVLHPDHLARRPDKLFPSWDELAAVAGANPEQFTPFASACEVIHERTLCWLNAAYERVNSTLTPLLGRDEYITMLGWETRNYGQGGMASNQFQQAAAMGNMSGAGGATLPPGFCRRPIG